MKIHRSKPPYVQASIGLSLIELMIVMAIVGFLVLVSGVNLYESKSRNDVLNCAKRMSADIKQARRWAMGGGTRVIFLTALKYGSTDTGAVDLDGAPVDPTHPASERTDEFYVVFPDPGDAGYVVGGTGALVHGTRGDALCDEDVVLLGESTLSSVLPGFFGFSASQLYFSSLGTLLNFGAANKNLYLEKNGHVARIEVVGLTGLTRIYVNREDYFDCGGNDCTPGTWSNGVNSQWQPVQPAL